MPQFPAVYLIASPLAGQCFIGTGPEFREFDRRRRDDGDLGNVLARYRRRRSLRSVEHVRQVDGIPAAKVRGRFDHLRIGNSYLYRFEGELLSTFAASALWDGEDAAALGISRPRPNQDRPAPIRSGLAVRSRP